MTRVGKSYYGTRIHLEQTGLAAWHHSTWAVCGVELKRGSLTGLDYPFGTRRSDCRHCVARLQWLAARKAKE